MRDKNHFKKEFDPIGKDLYEVTFFPKHFSETLPGKTLLIDFKNIKYFKIPDTN